MVAGADEETERPNSVLGKAQLLLAAFESGPFQLRLTELSRRSGVPKASAYRLAQELVQWGLLERRGESYQLGIRMFELGERVLASASLRAVARPLLTDLYTSTRATIHLAVLDGTHVLYLEKIAGGASIHSHSQVGGRLPAWCTATGKVLLAVSQSGREQTERLAETGLPSLTERTVVSVDALRRQLSIVAERGFALEVGETLSGYGSLAVPVIGEDGTVHAAVSATAPVAQVTAQRLVPQLRATAAGIARAMDRRMPAAPATTTRRPAAGSRGRATL
ncbi:IclR family transcriptional regulator [Streptomyces millisiae]|uniref:IclR family transcriptional regulator n=1 Tax=Streptomyces millisiae TaxID=3075542 RepID=A0ABU2LHC6_9ACTN|nr:IclR family transcriptional regulator [Streptomyces sp. DSM 44918]MDT0316991.1 IclR family transcriptional regulator [Streptomyces sp. DSM 44918]